ncbi:hypothetical protein [Glycomyces tenuis]|uniref:hypothetical protein n=1 Tax=Glycomyces tenuis TaxID=58116 RepID=UPI00047BD9A6|nr:hypothetical protein [Glycomyces tenuis]
MSERMRANAIRGLVAIAASVLMLVGFLPSAAQAEPSVQAEPNYAWAWWTKPDGFNGGLGEIRSNGENIVLEDFRPDGWGTRGQLQVQKYHPAGYYYWVDHGGVCFDDTNTSNSAGGTTVCERNVAEGTRFRIHVWASQDGTFRWHSYSPSIKA